MKSMNVFRINGKTYTGNNIVFLNGKVTIDGVRQDDQSLSGVVRVEVTGNLASLKCDAPVVVNGNVHGDLEVDGPVTCGDVGKDVKADGPVTCGNVNGNVEADGPVTCGNVRGNVVADIVSRN